MSLSKERQALLKQKSDNYIATMEATGNGVAYSRVATDKLLILEALNDWSGRLLVEGGDIKLNFGCDDPACASRFELSELMKRMHAAPVVLYPVSGFTLGDDDEPRFGYESSTFRMSPEKNGSRADAIMIAESSHIRDVEAAMSLWAMCANEDCLAYLHYQMDEHGLHFGDDELAAARQIITSALLTNFSAGQVWNAIWRSVRDAAALSARPYYNVAKASKTIPKKIDKVLTQNASARGAFQSYDRLASLPMGAVLTLLLNRFGIEDDSPGPEVREKFAADARLAPPPAFDEAHFDNGRALIQGTLFFYKDFTPLDRVVLSCFAKLETDPGGIQWDENHLFGQLGFTLHDDIYAFDGSAFFRLFLASKGILEPTQENLKRHAAAAQERKDKGSEAEDLSGYRDAIIEALLNAGVRPDRVTSAYCAIRYPATPAEVMALVHALSEEKGLIAIRASYAHLYDERFERDDGLHTGAFSFNFPEEHLEPDSCDSDLIIAIAGQNIDRLADLVASSFLRSVGCISREMKEELMLRVGQRLQNFAAPSIQGNGQAD